MSGTPRAEAKTIVWSANDEQDGGLTDWRHYVRFLNDVPQEARYVAIRVTGAPGHIVYFDNVAVRTLDAVNPCIMVAAPESPARARVFADFLCSSADQVNNSEIIRAAIATAQAPGGGGRIVLAEGTYDLLPTGAVQSNGSVWAHFHLPSNIAVFGSGKRTVLRLCGSDVKDSRPPQRWVFAVAGGDAAVRNVVIQDLQIQRLATSQAPLQLANHRCGGIYFSKVEDGLIKNVRFVDLAEKASVLLADSCKSSAVTQCHFKRSTNSILSGDVQDGEIVISLKSSSCVIKQSLFRGIVETGIYLNECSDIQISDNQLDGGGLSAKYGIRIGEKYPCNFVSVTGNHFRHLATAQTAAIRAQHASESLVANNLLEAPNRGIWIDQVTDVKTDTPFQSNMIQNNLMIEVETVGLLVDGYGNSVQANIVQSLGFGWQVGVDARKNSIFGNVLAGGSYEIKNNDNYFEELPTAMAETKVAKFSGSYLQEFRPIYQSKGNYLVRWCAEVHEGPGTLTLTYDGQSSSFAFPKNPGTLTGQFFVYDSVPKQIEIKVYGAQEPGSVGLYYLDFRSAQVTYLPLNFAHASGQF